MDNISFVYVGQVWRSGSSVGILCICSLRNNKNHTRRLVCSVIIRPVALLSKCCAFGTTASLEFNTTDDTLERLNFKHKIFMHLMKWQALVLVQNASVVFFALQILRRTYTEEHSLMRVKQSKDGATISTYSYFCS